MGWTCQCDREQLQSHWRERFSEEWNCDHLGYVLCCSLLGEYQDFGVIYCLCDQDCYFKPESRDGYPLSSIIKISSSSSVICQTTGPKPLPKRFLHILQSRASSFNWQYPFLSLRSSTSFLSLLPLYKDLYLKNWWEYDMQLKKSLNNPKVDFPSHNFIVVKKNITHPVRGRYYKIPQTKMVWSRWKHSNQRMPKHLQQLQWTEQGKKKTTKKIEGRVWRGLYL